MGVIKSIGLPEGIELYDGGCDRYEVRQDVCLTKSRSPIDAALRLEALFGSSKVMNDVLAQVRRVAPTSATVLITGESGTGKEITAKVIHEESKRSKHPFIVLNCGAISPQLIESELFGHEKGSFTGALSTRRGVFEQANGGTLFLDEVTEMPLDLQVKLLRVLETRRFVRVGGEREQEIDIRVIAATNRCAEEIAEPSLLRRDLFYRLQVFPIELPPLRDRAEDIRRLANQFVQELNEADGNNKGFSNAALLKLESHSWPGNLRELKNVVQRAYIMADHIIAVKDLPLRLVGPVNQARQRDGVLSIAIGTSVAEAEKRLIIATLDKCEGSKSEAARILGVSMKTLYNRLQQYNEEETA